MLNQGKRRILLKSGLERNSFGTGPAEGLFEVVLDLDRLALLMSDAHRNKGKKAQEGPIVVNYFACSAKDAERVIDANAGTEILLGGTGLRLTSALKQMQKVKRV